MSNFFSPLVTFTERPHLLVDTFAGSVNEFSDLQELILRDNDLTEILPDTFCKVNSIGKVCKSLFPQLYLIVVYCFSVSYANYRFTDNIRQIYLINFDTKNI